MKYIGDCLKNPELLHTAESGDVVTLKDEKFIFERVFGGIHLVSSDSDVFNYIENDKPEFSESGFLIEDSIPTYSSCIRHVRIDGRALVTTLELIKAIQSSSFTIDRW